MKPRPHFEGSGCGLTGPLHEIVSYCRAGVESPGSQAWFLPPTPDPVGTVACWAAWETELSAAFFGDGVIEFIFLGKIRGRICFSLCPRRQTRRRAKLRSAELMLQHHLLCGQLSPCTSCFPKNQTLQDWDLGSRGLEKASSLPLTGVFLSFF